MAKGIAIARFKSKLEIGDFETGYNAQDMPVSVFKPSRSVWFADYSIGVVASMEVNGTNASQTRVVAVRPETKISQDDFVRIGEQCYSIINIEQAIDLQGYDLITLKEYDATKANSSASDDSGDDDE